MSEIKPYCHQVQYYETDMMGVAHHSNYIRWMEEARIDFMEQLGFPYRSMEAEGVFSPVTKVSCEYKHSCTFGDRITVSVSVESFSAVTMVIRYTMRDMQETIVCTGTSEHTFLNREGRFVRLRKKMPGFCAAIEALMDRDEKQ